MSLLDHPFFSTEKFRSVFRGICRIVFRLHVEGLKNLPDGPAVLVSNHPSYFDPLFLVAAIPRRVNFVAWDKIWEAYPSIGRLAAKWGAFPVSLERTGRDTIEKAAQCLERGEIFGVFPEAGRSWRPLMGDCKPGSLRIAHRMNAPVIPCTMLGSFFMWHMSKKFPRPYPVKIILHEPIHLSDVPLSDVKSNGWRNETMERIKGIINGPIIDAFGRNEIDASRYVVRGSYDRIPDLITARASASSSSERGAG
ncbi:MAG: 1-acyl-sn-glycerol-3-phosphate acyltransferase [Planctomycetes bacterium]|nr:1-acyl-sn-glycerol-3-phosphate acyltransferase [Planctomycetota bacterium]